MVGFLFPLEPTDPWSLPWVIEMGPLCSGFPIGIGEHPILNSPEKGLRHTETLAQVTDLLNQGCVCECVCVCVSFF